MIRPFLIVLAFCFVFISKNASAVDPGLYWKTIESEHLYVHYAEGDKQIAERAAAIAEVAHLRLSSELNWQPVEKTHIVISDETDQPNGFASPIYFNHTVLFLAPPSSINTLEDFDDWMSTLIIHEYTHIIHLDKSASSPEYLRNIFGRFFLLFPNVFQPAWVTEGLATYKETDIERGIGRGQSTMFDSMMREELVEGLQPISHVNLPVSTWPAGTTRYLYGVYFVSFLVEKYGEEKLHQWVDNYSDNLLPFFINTNAEKTFDKDMEVLWQEYIEWLTDRFQPKIDEIEANGLKEGVKISEHAYRTDSVRAIETADGNEIYYVRNNGYKRASLIRIDSAGKSEDLIELNGDAVIDVHSDAGIILTQNEFCNNYTVYKDLYIYDKEINEIRRLTECGRYLYASWHPGGKSIFAVNHDKAIFELHRLDNKGQVQEILWKANDGQIIGQIDVSPDGNNIVASLWRKQDGWNIEEFSNDEKKWNKITTGTSIAAYPQYSADGNIIFSRENSGVYNLYRYLKNVDSIGKGAIEKITNVIGGAFQSSQAEEKGAIYYVGYSAEGYAIYKLNDSSGNEVSTVAASTIKEDYLQPVDYKSIVQQQSDYSALSNMYPRWWFPSLLFSNQRSELGLTTTGADALGIHNYSLTATYDFKLDKPAGQISYAYADRLYLSAVKLNEITVDTNDDLNRISDRSIISVVTALPDNYLQHQTNLLFSVVYDKTADDELAAGAVPFDDFEDHLLGVAWLYNSADLNPLSISLNDGMNLRLVAEDSDALGSDFTGQTYTLDWKQYIRVGREDVIALRFFQGWGSDQPRPFKLGGEGSNDDAVSIFFGANTQPVFNARNYALRGYKEGLVELRGRRAQILSGEWRFPLNRIEQGIMAPPIGIMQWFGTVFAETGSAYQDSPETYYSSAGLELIADLNVFYGLTLRTRAGYAHGFDEDIGDDVFYLRIGSSF